MFLAINALCNLQSSLKGQSATTNNMRKGVGTKQDVQGHKDSNEKVIHYKHEISAKVQIIFYSKTV